jgi:molybdopterin-containing oxidoreductase family iron-sulfur binding subunit
MNTRRNFLKFVGISAVGLGLAKVAGVEASGGGGHGPHMEPPHEGLHAKRWGMVIDTRKLKSPEAIAKLAAACHAIHNVPEIPAPREMKWIWAESFEGAFPDSENDRLNEEVEHRAITLLCNHCSNPPCVRVCPTKATFKRADGITMMDMHRCIGCRYCMAACPYGARSFNFGDPQKFVAKPNPEYPMRMRGVVEKCTFCSERLEAGKLPACVEASDGAILFGDLEDKNSPVRKALRENFTIRRKPSLGTQPSVYYII